MVFNAAIPVVAEEIEPEAIVGGGICVEEFLAEKDPLGGVDAAFENGVLNALAIIEADLGDPTQALFAVRG